jgi:hypothetical protein
MKKPASNADAKIGPQRNHHHRIDRQSGIIKSHQTTTQTNKHILFNC